MFIRNKGAEYFKKNRHLLVLGLILLFSSAIHFWNFKSNLLFRADQARDAAYAREALEEGAGHLRLLGPKVDMAQIAGDENSRGDTLHLGPFYYYFQYFFAFIFQSAQPWVFAFPDVLMFILSIPLFYYLSRQFFSKKISLSATALFAFCFFNLMYSRFGWNPNQLFFWEILFVLSLFKMSESSTKKRGGWFIGLVASLLVISQLHFVALTGFSFFLVIFVPFLRLSKIGLKYWLISSFLVVLFFLPMVISDVKNDGDNAKRFWVALTRQETEHVSLSKKVEKTYSRFGEFFALSLVSYNEKEIEPIEKLGGIFFIVSIIFIILSIFGRKWLKLTDNQGMLSFIILLWAFCFFSVFLKIYGKLDNTRYFIAISPLVFLIVGFWLSFLDKFKWKKGGSILIFVVTFLLLFLNFQAIFSWYAGLQKGDENFKYGRNLKLGPHDELITAGQIRAALGYMVEKAKVGNKLICFKNANYQYNVGFEYIGEINYPEVSFGRFNAGDVYSNCEYFFIGRSYKGISEIENEILANFSIKDEKKFQALAVWNLIPKEVPTVSLSRDGDGEQKKKRLRAETWAELFEDSPYYD